MSLEVGLRYVQNHSSVLSKQASKQTNKHAIVSVIIIAVKPKHLKPDIQMKNLTTSASYLCSPSP